MPLISLLTRYSKAVIAGFSALTWRNEMKLTENQVKSKLSGLPMGEDGAILQVHYNRIPGQATTERQIEESKIAVQRGIPTTVYTIKLLDLWHSKKDGSLILKGLVLFERKNLNAPDEPVYRNFNITRGTVSAIDIPGSRGSSHLASR